MLFSVWMMFLLGHCRSQPFGELSLNLPMVLEIVPSCLGLSQKLSHSIHLSKQIASREYERDVKNSCIIRPQIMPSSNHAKAVGPRVFMISDLHADYSENMTWMKDLSTMRHKKDVLLVAGDVAETYHNFVLTMSLLTDKFEYVFYVPGNHDLWCRREEEDSVRNIPCFQDFVLHLVQYHLINHIWISYS